MTRYSYAKLMGRRVSAQVIPGLEDDPITRFLFRSGGTFDLADSTFILQNHTQHQSKAVFENYLLQTQR